MNRKLLLTLLFALTQLLTAWSQLSIAASGMLPHGSDTLQLPEVAPTEFMVTVDKTILVGEPDETITFTVRITNNSTLKEEFAVGAYNYDSGFIISGIYNDRYNRNAYRTFFDVEPNEQYQLEIGVHIPAYATNGMVHHIEPHVRGQRSNFTAELQLTTVVSTPTRLRQVARLGLSPQDVFIQGNYAYLVAGQEGLRIWDIARPTAPTEVGSYDPQDNLFWSANKVVVMGSYAYVAAGQAGLRVLDISNPTEPLEIGSYSVPGSAEDVQLVGPYAYVTWPVCHYPPCSGKLQIVDVSDPTNPLGVSTYDNLQIHDIDIVGQFAYIATAGFTGAGGMHVLDISNPASPVEVGVYELGGSGGANGVTVHSGYAYLLVGGSGKVIDVSNPENPMEVGQWSYSKFATKINLVDQYLYLSGPNTAAIFDITDPTHPIEMLGNYDTLNDIKSLQVVNNKIYLAAGTTGLKLLDLSNPIDPKPLGVFGLPSFAQAVTLANNYVYVADIYNGLRIIDISEPLTPTEIGYFNKPGGASAIQLKDHYAYVNLGKCDGPNDCDTTLYLLDISTPATPVEIASYENWTEFEIVGDYAYVLDETNWLHIFDISNPATPIKINTLKEPVADFALANGYLYLLPPIHNFQFASGQNSFTQDSYLKIFDPISLTEISTLHLPNEYPARSIHVANDYAYIYWAVQYVNASADGWVRLDISNPSDPVLREDINKPEYLQPTAVDGHYAYFAAGTHGLRIFDISDPANPIEVDAYGADNRVMDVAVANDYIYTANGSGGLAILNNPKNEFD